MEDRDTPGLWLEMTDRPAAAYGAERAPVVLDAVPGAQRATWWANLHRDRTDLPRKLPECSTLGVYELEAGAAPPAPAALPGDLTGYHYVRTGRPGQGRLTGRPTVGLSLVLISPRDDDQEQALRDWADFVHLRHIVEAAVPGYTMITPYRHATGGDPRFLHLYEMDTAEAEEAFTAMTPLVAERLGPPGTPAFDAWATTPSLRIMYVNSFRLVGELTAP